MPDDHEQSRSIPIPGMKGPQMRWLISVLAVLGLASPALAQDFDVLRGSEPVGAPSYWNWSGFYVGGQAAYVSGGADFANATQPLVAYLLRNSYVEENFGVSGWTTLGKEDSSSAGFGGFVGYNTQWANAVLGLEASYTNTNWGASASDSLSRHIDSNGTTYSVSVSGTSSIKLHDFASLRGRAGYAMGRFMPYATLGFVVGRADIMKSASVTESETNDTTGELTGYLPLSTDTEGQANKFIYGYSAGLGLDMALTHNIFLRTEYEYVQFVGLDGLKLYLNTARAGAGIKF
jgi:outer membrane immunogenic protein